MSDVFVARQPIFDADSEVSAYELLFRGGAAMDTANVSDNDAATSTVIINAFTELGLDNVVGDHRAWINVSRDFMVGKLADALPAERVCLELLENERVDAELIAAIDELRARGFKIALDDFADDPTRGPLLECVDYVKVELMGRSRDEIAADVERLKPYGMTLLAEKVETREDQEFCAELGFDLFQGYFFCKPEQMAAKGVAPNRLALLQLVAALQDPAIEFSQLETLISRDLPLSYRLLRYINSAFFGLRREVSSIGRALTLLGLENVKKWTTLTVFAGMEEKPRELIVTALVRAHFCELAGERFGEKNADQLFTLGLFSVVDALMDAPMKEVVESIPFPADMRDALIQGKGPKGELLDAALRCERGRFPARELADAHVQALAWATEAAEQLFDEPPVTAEAA